VVQARQTSRTISSLPEGIRISFSMSGCLTPLRFQILVDQDPAYADALDRIEQAAQIYLTNLQTNAERR
jgi:hypothetical protein